MRNRAVIAVAGAGKTEVLAEEVVSHGNPLRTLVLTYTVTNQREDAARIAQKAADAQSCPTVMGWRSFLMNEIVLPYLPMLFPGQQLRGLAPHDPKSFRYLKGKSQYFTQDSEAWPSHLGRLAKEVNKASGGAAIKRIECMYDRILIDEAQDLRGNDLCMLELLLKSSIEITAFLDPRQSTLTTAQMDSKYSTNYKSVRIVELYMLWERKRLLTIEHMNETHRSTQAIADFSDLIFHPDTSLERTVSKVVPRGRHDGIFLIAMDDFEEYAERYSATVLSAQLSERMNADEALNFGKAKGLTRDDVVIRATDPIEQFLKKGTPLRPKSACGFYVAVTRARYSVAIAVKNPQKTLAAMQSQGSIWSSINVRVEERDGNES